MYVVGKMQMKIELRIDTDNLKSEKEGKWGRAHEPKFMKHWAEGNGPPIIYYANNQAMNAPVLVTNSW